MALDRIQNDLQVTGNFTAGTMSLPSACVANAQVASNAEIVRTKLAQDTVQPFPVDLAAFFVHDASEKALAQRAIDLYDWRVHDAPQTVLPNPSAADDLGTYGATAGTNAIYLATYDVKAAGAVTLYARRQITLPHDYIAGQAVTLRASAGMITTVADTTATVDFQVYENNRSGGVGADICATAAQSINSLTFANKDFTITPTALAAGDALDVRVAIAVNDGATGTAVIGAIGAIDLLYDADRDQALPPICVNDDLGFYVGTYATNPPMIRTYDVKAAGALTFYARCLIELPECYDAGETVQIRLAAGQLTTIADTTCTVDVEAWQVDEDGTLGSADLCTTAAQSIRSLTFANKDFTITATDLAPGEILDVRVTVAVNDAATGTAVYAAIAAIKLLCDIRG